MKSDFTQQVASPGVTSIFLKNGVSLLASLGILRRRHKEASQLQARADVSAVQINRPGERLDGRAGVLLLDLDQAQAVMCLREIGVDLNGLLVFVSGFSELLLFEIAIALRHMLFRARGATARKQDCRHSQQKKKDREASASMSESPPLPSNCYVYRWSESVHAR
jgi:hypothetical protein